MVEFAATCPDTEARQALEWALQGKGAFRRFWDTVYERYPSLVGEWHDYPDRRSEQVARDWLVEQRIVPGG